jgi:hypothetical protein
MTELHLHNIKLNENDKIDKRIEEIKNQHLQKKIEYFNRNKKEIKEENKIYEQDIRLNRQLTDTNFHLNKIQRNKKKKFKEVESLNNISINH